MMRKKTARQTAATGADRGSLALDATEQLVLLALARRRGEAGYGVAVTANRTGTEG